MQSKSLEWHQLDNHFGKSWVASIPQFKCVYGIWIERDSGKVLAVAPDGTRYGAGSIDEAKSICQKDFEERVSGMVIEN
jgi:hypothetical protein